MKEWAREQGVHPVTAYRWFREGKLPVPARRAGRLILVDPDPKPVPVGGMVAAYCRVSSAEQKDDLERQIGRVVAEATGRGLAVGRVVSEVGSGRNGHRRKLTKLLSDPAVTVGVVEHRELTRFGFEHLAASMSACGRRIVVLDATETSDDLVRDVTEVLTSLCARLYGRRSASRRAAKAVAVATDSELG